MQKLNGVFDNRDTMQREAWIDGEMAVQWPAAMCEDMTQTLLPWEREVLEKPWGLLPESASRAFIDYFPSAASICRNASLPASAI